MMLLLIWVMQIEMDGNAVGDMGDDADGDGVFIFFRLAISSIVSCAFCLIGVLFHVAA